ncbi:MAG TPA: sugar nucleotide-binding protein, partial [Opitutaceae bacterium]
LSCRFVHISSEQVFDGTHPPYARADAPSPVNTYGRQKVESEQLVHAAAPDFSATVRAPLLMGNSLGGTRSVHEGLFANWSAGRSVRLYTDEVRQPCTADNLADVLVELCERGDLNGVFHWAGAEALSRFELGSRIARHFGVPAVGRIETALLAGSPAAALRPANLALDLKPLAGFLKTRVQTIDEQLETLRVPLAARAWWSALPK